MKIKIHTVNGPLSVEVERRVGRVWAIHRELTYAGFAAEWTLTHIPTGKKALGAASRAALTEAAKLLPPRWREHEKFGGGNRVAKPAGYDEAVALLAADGELEP